MGTQAATYFIDGTSLDGEPLVSFYRHYDGYPTVHGAELVDALADFRETNGLKNLAASVIANLVARPNSTISIEKEPYGEWEYTIAWDILLMDEPLIRVWHRYTGIEWEGPLSTFIPADVQATVRGTYA